MEIEPAHGTWDKHTDKHALVTDRRYANAADGHATDAGGHGHAITIETSQISRVSSYEPAHSTFFAVYYTLTGLHALHVFGGILVMLYHLMPISRACTNLTLTVLQIESRSPACLALCRLGLDFLIPNPLFILTGLWQTNTTQNFTRIDSNE